MVVYGRNGSFKVKNQRYIMEGGSSTTYLALCSRLSNGQYSQQLGNFIEEWSSTLSYAKLSELLLETTGKEVARLEQDPKRLDTTVVLVEGAKSDYHYTANGINRQGEAVYEIKQAIIDKVCELHKTDKPLSLVAITDGARSIRLTLESILGLPCASYSIGITYN